MRTSPHPAFAVLPLLLATSLLLTTACDRQKPPSFSCTDPLGCVDLAPNEPIRLGVLQSLSGKVEPLGREQVRGFELALDARQGIILGHPISLQIEDTGCTSEGGANAALKIIADPRMVAIFGTTCSGAAATAAKAMSDAGLTMISGNNSAPFLTSIAGHKAPHWQDGYFRTAANEEYAGQTAASYAYIHLGLRRAATINDGDIYTRGLTEGFAEAFRRHGGEVVLETSINKGDTDMLPVLSAASEAKADLLFFPLFQPEGNAILLEARANALFAGMTLMSDGALIEASFLEAVGEAARGLYFVGPVAPTGAAVDSMAAQYTQKFNAPPGSSYYLSAYDAATLLFDGIQSAAIQSEDGSLRIGRRALRDAVYATRNLEGVTGRLSCNEFGDCAAPAFNILRCDDPAAGITGLQANVISTFTP